jgi:hypothetical protein
MRSGALRGNPPIWRGSTQNRDPAFAAGLIASHLPPKNGTYYGKNSYFQNPAPQR